MRRTIMLVSIVTVMAAMMMAGAIPALAVKPPAKPPQSEDQQGKYTCTRQIVTNPGEPVPIYETQTEPNVPAGQVYKYPESEGWECKHNRSV